MLATVCCLFFLLFSLFQFGKKLENKAETLYLKGKIQAKNFSATDPASGTETKKRKKKASGKDAEKRKGKEKRGKRKKERQKRERQKRERNPGHFEKDKRDVLEGTGTDEMDLVKPLF